MAHQRLGEFLRPGQALVGCFGLGQRQRHARPTVRHIAVDGCAGRVDDSVVVGEELCSRDVLAEGDVSEEAEAGVRGAQAKRTQAGTASEQVAISRSRAAGADAQVAQARAAVERARLDLEHTSIKASDSGVVSKKTVEVGQVDDVTKCVTMDLKEPGNRLFVVGLTTDELGGSHFSLVHGCTGGQVPRVDPAAAGFCSTRNELDLADAKYSA